MLKFIFILVLSFLNFYSTTLYILFCVRSKISIFYYHHSIIRKKKTEDQTLFNKAKLVEKYKGSENLHKPIINHTGAQGAASIVIWSTSVFRY